MHLCEIATTRHNVHIEHGTSAAIRWCTCVRHSSKALSMHTNAKTARHGPIHLLVEVHHVQRITHLLLVHHDIAARRILLLVYHHIVDANLTLAPTLLRSHRHVIRLVHRVLVRVGLVTSNLALLALRILRL